MWAGYPATFWNIGKDPFGGNNVRMVLTVELYEGHGVHKTVGQYTQEDESPTSTLCEMNQIHSPMIQRYSSFGEYRFL
jgi:hypothetical protein